MANWRGTWSSGTAYAAGDSVSYNGVSYYCVTASTGQAPGGADWALLDSFRSASGGSGISPPAGDIGGTAGTPAVVSTHLSSPLPVAQGGTAAATQQAAVNSLTGTQSAGRYLRSDGTNASLAAIQAGDLPAATTGAQGAVILDGTAGDIRAAGTTAAAGTSTKAAAADHVHVQSFAGVLGDGSDGAVVLDGTAAYSFLSKSGSTYTCTRDTLYASLTVSAGVTLNVGNTRTYCTGTLTNNGTIISNGNAGQASGTAGGAASNWSFHAGGGGGAGNTGAGSAGTGITVNVGGASGGTGGTGSSGAAGAAGTNTGGAATHTEYLRSPAVFATGQVIFASASQQVTGGCGGGGGGGDGTNKGGGGGAGGGVLGIAAASIINNGSITATGGAGGTPAAGNCGGGGGGGGGVVWTFSLAAPSGSGSMTAAGGAASSGVGTGTGGSAGSAGTVLNVVLT